MKRIQFEIPVSRNVELEVLMEKAGIATKKDFFNTALTLLEWVIDEVSLGREIASINKEDKEIKQLVMPFFGNVQKIKNN